MFFWLVSVKNVINIDFKSVIIVLYYLFSIGVFMWWNFLDLYLNGKIISLMIIILIEFYFGLKVIFLYVDNFYKFLWWKIEEGMLKRCFFVYGFWIYKLGFLIYF